jgi:hypothetical protein
MSEPVVAEIPKTCRDTAPAPLRLLRLALVVVLFVLAILVYSSPPDPTWIAGVWDQADYDDVVAWLIDISAGGDLTTRTPGLDLSVNGFLTASPRQDSSLPFRLRSPPRG